MITIELTRADLVDSASATSAWQRAVMAFLTSKEYTTKSYSLTVSQEGAVSFKTEYALNGTQQTELTNMLRTVKSVKTSRGIAEDTKYEFSYL